MSAEAEWAPPVRLVDLLLEEQRTLTAVDEFAAHHEAAPHDTGRYETLIPGALPGEGEQYAFRVDLDACTGCKACVTACHSLNGLEPEETWRRVGLVESGAWVGSSARQQTVTTACHHCEDPGCLSGCPVRAYDKDPTTGIVRHLDDQCIGCRYCQLMCPYDVPTYSERLGIVRKCDMCHARLAEGEAPACVQGCPNEAISIAVVAAAATEEAPRLLDVSEGAIPESHWTRPTTQYVSGREPAIAIDPVDLASVSPAEGHTPLATMLVLTQASIGAIGLDALFASFFGSGWTSSAGGVFLPSLALVVGLAGLAASVLHLGRPQWAFRAILGLRTSWMSREIVVLGGYAGALVAAGAVAWATYLAGEGAGGLLARAAEGRVLAPWAAFAVGGLGLLCSIQIYAVTGRPLWRFRRTASRFVSTAAWAGVAAAHLGLALGLTDGAETAADSPRVTQAALALVLVALTRLRLYAERRALSDGGPHEAIALERSRRLLGGLLEREARARRLALVASGIAMPLLALATLAFGGPPFVTASLAALALAGGLASDLVERSLFFRAEAMPSMPGVG